MTWHPDIPEEYRNQIVTGDARELAKRIPDESIDLIFTDPVYDRIEDYEWLAETAARVLINGGMLLAQIDQKNRFAAECSMRPFLNPLPLIAEVYPFAKSYTGFSNIMSGWKPYIWLFKGEKRRGKFAVDRHHGGGVDKRFHKWGDSAKFFVNYTNALSDIGDALFDPFVGSGTVPAVCKILGRNYIAFEIDPETADLARGRVLNTQPPLFVPEPEQLELRNTQEPE